MDYYNAVANSFIALISALSLGIVLKWFGYHLTARDVAKLAKQTEHDLLITCQLELKMERQHNDDLHATLNQFLRRYREKLEIDRHDVEAIELELAQRPKVGKQ